MAQKITSEQKKAIKDGGKAYHLQCADSNCGYHDEIIFDNNGKLLGISSYFIEVSRNWQDSKEKTKLSLMIIWGCKCRTLTYTNIIFKQNRGFNDTIEMIK